MKKLGRPRLPKSDKYVVIGVALPPRLLSQLDKRTKEFCGTTGIRVSRSAMITKILTHVFE